LFHRSGSALPDGSPVVGSRGAEEFMRLTLACILAAVCLIPTSGLAVSTPLSILQGNATIDPEMAKGNLPGIHVIATGPSGLTLEFALPAVAIEEVMVEGERYQALTIPGGGLVGELGSPQLPTFSRMVSIPDRAGVRIEASVTEEETMGDIRVAPALPQDGGAFHLNAAAYARDDFGAEPTAYVGRPAILRDLRIVPITFQPIRYNAARGEMKIARTIRVEVHFEGEDPENQMPSIAPRPIAPSFDRMYRDLVVNYRGAESGLLVQPGTWVVICPNDNAVVTRLQPLLDWHKRKGYPVRLATTAETGTNSTAIKNWLTNAYNTWPTPPEFVALAGDADGSFAIPTWFENLSGYGGCGDHPYTQLAGGDILADVNLGRLSFTSTAELDLIVNKCVGYESTPYTAQDPNWFTRACVVGDPGSSGYSVVQLQQWAKTRLLQVGYTQVDTIFGGDFAAQMTTSLNRGDTVFSYRGWLGMSGFGTGNIYALTNGWKLPFCVVITCDTGTFAGGTSRTEAFLRAASGGNPRGGIGAIGTATSGTHTQYNNAVHYGVLYGLLYQDLYTMGAALTRGKLEMYLNYQGTDPTHVTIWSHWNNLMGDPGLECWTGYPAAIEVTHPTNLAIGANSVTVTVKENHTVPLAGAQVCLVKDTETFVVGFTNAMGQVELPVSAATAGNMQITVTKHNYYPYLATIPVAAGTVYVGYQASTVNDDNVGSSHGNGNGIVNPAETIELAVQLKNFGTQTASGVSATLTTSDPYAAITDATKSFGNIAPGGSAWSSGSYVLSISPLCPHGRQIRLGLEITSGANSWHSLIDLPVVSADLACEGVNTFNVGGNGIFDPGETGQVSIKLGNSGGMTATAVTASVTSLSAYVTVIDGTASFGDIPADGSIENTGDRFTFSAAPETFRGSVATFRAVCDFSGGLKDTLTFDLTIGTRTSADPTGPDGYGYFAFDNTDTAYPYAPAYSWIELNGDPGATQITLSDNGTYQDDSAVIDLDFPFTYYGATYTKATVCSNGWLAMGGQWNNTEYRNWTIPGAGGPQAMIAAFWDDLNLASGGRVLRKYDVANHRTIIEWSAVHNEMESAETFEIILYDPAYHATGTGDGIIEVQYNVVNNTDSGDNYATVGIENVDQSDGVLYTYDSLYSSGSATLAAGRAIRFMPVTFQPGGTLQGYVRNVSNGGSPIEGAQVRVLQNGRSFVSAADGSYGGPMAAGTFTVVALHEGFEPDTARNVVVLVGQATDQDFSLVDVQGPSISGVTNDSTTMDTVGPYPIEATITDESGVTAKLFYRLNGSGWIELPMTGAGDLYTANLPGRSAGTQIDYYVWAQDGADLVSLSPPDAPASFYTLYITSLVYNYTVEDPEDLNWQLGIDGDNASTGQWVRVDPNGTEYGGVTMQPEDDSTTNPGVLCFITGQGSVGGAAGDADVDGGCTTLLSPVFDLSQSTMAFFTYHRWYGEGGNSTDDEFAVDVSSDGGSTWFAMERVPDIDNAWRKVTKNLTDYITLTGQVQVRFLACDLNTAGLVEAGIDDVGMESFVPNSSAADDPVAIPVRTALAQNNPNPFNPKTAIRFDLSSPARARLEIFSASGRLVRTLVDAAYPAGSHHVLWDGRDDAGHAVGSGIYFYRLRAGSFSESRRMTILK
jgi:hypothetical protein